MGIGPKSLATILIAILVVSDSSALATAASNPGAPDLLTVNPNNNTIYVTIFGSGSSNYLGVINGTTNKLSTTVQLNYKPTGIGVNESNNQVWVEVCLDEACDNTALEVFDPITLQVVTSLNGYGLWGCTWVNDSSNNLIYVVQSTNDSVFVENAHTLALVTTIYTGHGGECITLNPRTNTLYVTNLFAASVSVIDANTNTVTATVQVGDGPAGIGVNPNTGLVYVANVYGNSVSVIDGKNNAVVTTIPITILTASTTTMDSTTSATSSPLFVPGTNYTQQVQGALWVYTNSHLAVGSDGNAVASLTVTPAQNFVQSAPGADIVSSFQYSGQTCSSAAGTAQLILCADVSLSAAAIVAGDVQLLVDLFGTATPGGLLVSAIGGTFACNAVGVAVSLFVGNTWNSVTPTQVGLVNLAVGAACQLTLDIAATALLGTPIAFVVNQAGSATTTTSALTNSGNAETTISQTASSSTQAAQAGPSYGVYLAIVATIVIAGVAIGIGLSSRKTAEKSEPSRG
ncbi:MAG: YncE family protein [Nitrososphaerota archaeon]|nr:YncE family protein [Nitrososphaerota archaeon]